MDFLNTLVTFALGWLTGLSTEAWVAWVVGMATGMATMLAAPKVWQVVRSRQKRGDAS